MLTLCGLVSLKIWALKCAGDTDVFTSRGLLLSSDARLQSRFSQLFPKAVQYTNYWDTADLLYLCVFYRILLTCIACLSSYSVHLLLRSAGVVGKFLFGYKYCLRAPSSLSLQLVVLNRCLSVHSLFANRVLCLWVLQVFVPTSSLASELLVIQGRF